MSDQPCETPLVELARSVPKDLRGEWETQWFEDGTPCGHAMAPVGKYLHEMADEIERLAAEVDGAWHDHGIMVEQYKYWSAEARRLRAALQAIIDDHYEAPAIAAEALKDD